jgi:hypothetical protein
MSIVTNNNNNNYYYNNNNNNNNNKCAIYFPQFAPLLTEAVGRCDRHVFTLCSSSLGSRGSELRASAHSNFSHHASTFFCGAEPYLDEQLADDDQWVCKKVRASHLLTTRSEGEQQLATDDEHINAAVLGVPNRALRCVK